MRYKTKKIDGTAYGTTITNWIVVDARGVEVVGWCATREIARVVASTLNTRAIKTARPVLRTAPHGKAAEQSQTATNKPGAKRRKAAASHIG